MARRETGGMAVVLKAAFNAVVKDVGKDADEIPAPGLAGGGGRVLFIYLYFHPYLSRIYTVNSHFSRLKYSCVLLNYRVGFVISGMGGTARLETRVMLVGELKGQLYVFIIATSSREYREDAESASGVSRR